MSFFNVSFNFIHEPQLLGGVIAVIIDQYHYQNLLLLPTMSLFYYCACSKFIHDLQLCWAGQH